MKKFTLISALAIAALAFISVSCINKEYNVEDAKATATIEVNKTSELPPQTFLGFDDNQAVKPDEKGDLHFESSSETLTTTAEPGEPVIFPESLKVEMLDAPEIMKKSSGGELTDPAVKVTVSNPSSTPVIFSGKLSVDGSTPVILPSVEIPADKAVDLLFTPDVKSPAEPADIFAELPAELKNQLSKGMDQGMVFSDIVLTPKAGPKTAGRIKPAAAGPLQFSVSGMFVAPLSFVKGSVINLTQSFSDLGFDLDKYVTGSLEFDVNFSGTNFLTFDVDFSAVSEGSKLTGKLNKTIAAAQGPQGTPFDAVFVVKTLSSKAVINDVKLNIVLKAAQTPSVLNIKEPFIITADSVKIIK